MSCASLTHEAEAAVQRVKDVDESSWELLADVPVVIPAPAAPGSCHYVAPTAGS